MSSLNSQERRQARLNATYAYADVLNDRVYNLILGAVVLLGLVINVIICKSCVNVYQYVNPLVFLIGYFVCVIAGTMISARSQSPYISLFGYALVVVPVGLVVSVVVDAYGGTGSLIVTNAFLLTAIITGVMVVLSIAFPGMFLGLGRMLLGALIGIIVCELICMLFGIQQTITAWIAAGIFSLYIGYDIQRAQIFPKTADNAVDCALDIYLDIINLFLRLVRILGARGNSGSGRK